MTSSILTLDLPPDHPLRMILDVIETHPEVREPLLRVLLTERLLALPEQVDKLQSDFEEFRDETRARFDGIDQRFDGIDQRFDGIDQRLDGIDQRLDGIDQRFDGIDQRLDENTGAIRRLEGHVGRLVGASYEDLCRAEIAGILDGQLDQPVLADRNRSTNGFWQSVTPIESAATNILMGCDRTSSHVPRMTILRQDRTPLSKPPLPSTKPTCAMLRDAPR